MRKLKLMSMISAAFMALVMAVSLTGCGNDASSVNRSKKTTTKSVSEDKDAAKKDDADTDEDKSEESKSEETKSEDKSDAEEQVAETTMSEEEWEEYQESDEHIKNAACQAAGQAAQDAVRAEFGDGDWRTNYPSVVSFTDKDNYDINVEIYKEDEPDTVYTYHFVNANGSFSIERVG